MSVSSKKTNNVFDSKIDRLFKRVPALGKVVSAWFQPIETTMLDFLYFVSKIFHINAFDYVMKRFFKGRWGGKVIPLNLNYSIDSRFLPSEEILSLLARSHVLGIGTCYCRMRQRQRSEKPNCNHPTYTCIHIGLGNSLYDIPFKSENLKRVSKEEVKKVLSDAEKSGLVHQIIYFGSPQFYYVVCNCCACCCATLSNFLKQGAPQIVKSEFIAETDPLKCKNCGTCVKRCYFGARKIVNNRLIFNKTRCFGCGLCCGTICPNNAIKLKRKSSISQ